MRSQVAREVGSIPSAAQVSALLEARVGWVKAALARAEVQTATDADAARAAHADAHHLHATLGQRLAAVELEAATARRLVDDAARE
jgi:hypothetical protein